MTPAAVRQEGDRAAEDRERLILAIVQEESGGDCSAINPTERAVGPIQIRNCYLQDANDQLHREGRRGYSMAECMTMDGAREVFWAYMRRYHRADASPEIIARTHCGGPMGPHRKVTIPYAAKVKAALEAQK
jgi:hypothetical protein